MTAAVPPVPDLAGPVGRRVAAGLTTRPTTYGARGAVRDVVHAGHRWEVTANGRIVGTRRGAVTGRDLSGDLVAAYARDHALGHRPDDPFGGRLTDDPVVAREIADEVAAMLRRQAATSARATVLTLEASAASRVLSTRIAWSDRHGTVWWRDAGPADPVTGGPGARLAPPTAGERGRSLLDRWRGRPADAVAVTLDAVEAAGRPTLTSHERPDWTKVHGEIVWSCTPAAAPPADDGTDYLRRIARKS